MLVGVVAGVVAGAGVALGGLRSGFMASGRVARFAAAGSVGRYRGPGWPQPTSMAIAVVAIPIEAIPIEAGSALSARAWVLRKTPTALALRGDGSALRMPEQLLNIIKL